MNRPLFALAAGAILLAGCTLAPDYERPALPVSADWPDGSKPGAARAGDEAPAPAELGWRDFFSDPEIQSLIGMALTNNRDLRAQTLSVEAARAQYQIARADLFPSISATGNGSDQRVPANLSSSGAARTQRQFSTGLGFTAYELDLFGRIQSLSEQAEEQYLAQAETRTSSQITLVAEVANADLPLRADSALLRLTIEPLRSQRDSYDLVRREAEHGIATELDLRQAETAVRTAEASLAQYTRQVAQDRNALELLLGSPLPASFATQPGAIGLPDNPPALADLPAGIPSALLERRPDIRAAEHSLKAANANIGAARAAFFPAITLTASGGLTSATLSDLFKGAQRTWSFSPAITVPIFEGGRLEAQLDYAKISKEISVAQYEKTIQTAFREVADALAARATLDDQIRAQQALVDASEVRYRLSQMRFQSGIEGYLNTLDAERTLFSARQTLISIRLARLQNLVTLYKVLGGGWAENTVPPPPAAG
ncbi:MAG: efflux transporter outer membrane subunit [Telmatospirillum sp.]|nr:efflux transporter outer membrane subunit [Telmatospirillum sp.]